MAAVSQKTAGDAEAPRHILDYRICNVASDLLMVPVNLAHRLLRRRPVANFNLDLGLARIPFRGRKGRLGNGLPFW